VTSVCLCCVVAVTPPPGETSFAFVTVGAPNGNGAVLWSALLFLSHWLHIWACSGPL
jgi:hypothetical protein